MKCVRYLTLVFGIVMTMTVAVLWRSAVLTGDLAWLAGAAALVLLAVSLGSPSSPGRWRLLTTGWVIFICVTEIAAIMAFVSHADPAVSWGFSALTLGGVVGAILSFLQQRRSRQRYFEGYFRN